MGVHHLVIQVRPEHILQPAVTLRGLAVLYVGPDQMLPLTSALGAIVGLLLIFWQRTVAFVRKGWRLLLQKLHRAQSPKT